MRNISEETIWNVALLPHRCGRSAVIGFIQIRSKRRLKSGQHWATLPGVESQLDVLKLAAGIRKTKITDLEIGRRTNRNASPLAQHRFLNAIQKSREAGTPLIVVDVFELVSAMPVDLALEVLEKLDELDVSIFSAIHGLKLDAMPRSLRITNLAHHLSRSREKSARVKNGLVQKEGRHPEPGKEPSLRTRRMGSAVVSAKADAFAKQTAPKIDEVVKRMPEAQRSSYRAIARALNADGAPAPRGGQWSDTQVRRTLDRIDSLKSAE